MISSPRLRRAPRRLASWLTTPRLELVYSERYQLDLPGIDPQRGERILAALDAAGLLRRRAVHRAEPAPVRDLRRVHTDAYLDSLSRPSALLSIFGFELPEYAVERALEGQRTMVGGTQLAAQIAMATGRIAANLGGGLHHAFADRGERFCIFNDVAVAIAGLRAGGFTGRVLVIDLDLHDDDGTRTIFAHDPSVHTFSVHNRTTVDVPAVAATVVELGAGVGDDVYLDAVEERLPGLLAAVRPDLVVYLAGCDPAADDALGDWLISPAGMLRRDRLVVELTRRGDHRAPLVVLLAGGYGHGAWRYSARFLSSLRPGGRPVEPPSTAEVTLTRYRRLAREQEHAARRRSATTASALSTLSALSALSTSPPNDDDLWQLSAGDLAASLPGPQRPHRLLGAFSCQQLELTLERAGLLDRLRQLGFSRPTLRFDLEHPGGETVQVWSEPEDGLLLAEIRLRIDRRSAPGFSMLRVEWLLLQNPRAAFTPARPRLPGQEHPGLGMLHDTIAMLIVACERLQLDGLLWVPAHFHVAAQSKRGSRFLHAAEEGVFRALERALVGLPLPAAAFAVENGGLRDAATDAPFIWHPMTMLVPACERLRALLAGPAYQEEAAAVEAAHTFVLA